MTEQEAIFEINCHERGMDHESKLFEALECGVTAMQEIMSRRCEKNKPLDSYAIVENFVGKPIWYQNIKGKYESGWMLLVKLDFGAMWIRYVLVTLKGETIKLWKGSASVEYNFYAHEPKGAER